MIFSTLCIVSNILQIATKSKISYRTTVLIWPGAVENLKSVYIPKLTEPTWVPSAPRLTDSATLTMNSMTCCQLSSDPTLVSRMLPEWSTTNEMSSRHAECRDAQHHRPSVLRCTLQQVSHSYSYRVIASRLAFDSWFFIIGAKRREKRKWYFCTSMVQKALF